MDPTAKVVSALMEIGPHYTRISEITDVPTSTVRYIINEKLPKLGLTVKPVIDHNMLGLERYMVFLDINSPPYHATMLLDIFGKLLYLDYYTYLMKERKFLVLFVIPPNFEESFHRFLEKLVETGVFQSYDAKKLNYIMPIPLRVECFDFRRGVWIQNWENIPRKTKVIESTNEIRINVSKLDLRILAEFQKNIFAKHVEIAKKLGVSRQTVKRHYEKIVKVIRHYMISWFPPRSPDLVATPIIVNLPSTYSAREAILNIPFSYMEMSSEDQEYYALLLLPSIEFYRTIKYLTERIKVKEIHFQNMEYSAKFLIHHNLYREQVGWLNTFEEGIEEMMERVRQFGRHI